MNHNRNNKINQMTEDTLVIGIDIAKKTHYACRFGRSRTRASTPHWLSSKSERV